MIFDIHHKMEPAVLWSEILEIFLFTSTFSFFEPSASSKQAREELLENDRLVSDKIYVVADFESLPGVT